MRLLTLHLLISGFFASPAHATDFPSAVLHRSIQTAFLENAIDWQVGDTANYQLTMRSDKGTMVQSVTEDEGTSLWMRQTFIILGRSQIVDVQIDKAEGKVLKVLQNGQVVETPRDDDIEILSAEEAKVTVPAGTFDAVHIVAQSKGGQRLEIWSNAEATIMDGVIKEIIGTDLGNIVLELVTFKHAVAAAKRGRVQQSP